jgi:hypothetical protein
MMRIKGAGALFMARTREKCLYSSLPFNIEQTSA